MKSKLFKKPKISKKGIVVTGVGLLVVFTPVFLFFWFMHNPARDIASPIEKSLIEAGAVKKCETQDAGKGPDNTRPWYTAIYTISRSFEDTKKAVQDILIKHGYSLAPWDQNVFIASAQVHVGFTKRDIKLTFRAYDDKTYDESSRSCSLRDKSKDDGATTFVLGVQFD